MRAIPCRMCGGRSAKYKVSPADYCIICMEDYDNKRKVTLDCYHSFHVYCCIKWISKPPNTCPLCRRIITNIEITRLIALYIS